MITGIIIFSIVFLILFLFYIINKSKKTVSIKPTGSTSISCIASNGIEPTSGRIYIRKINKEMEIPAVIFTNEQVKKLLK